MKNSSKKEYFSRAGTAFEKLSIKMDSLQKLAEETVALERNLAELLGEEEAGEFKFQADYLFCSLWALFLKR
jgi:hypothetical protein